MQAAEIMTKPVVTIKGSTTVEEIAKVMSEQHLSGLPVVDSAEQLIGIVTEGDLLRREMNPRLPAFINIFGAVIYFGGVERYNEDFKKMLAQKAADIMTAEVFTVQADTDISEIAHMMLDKNIKQVPVVNDGRLVGIISRADIVKLLLK